MTYYDDHEASCPRCESGLAVVDLCEHDDPDTGPLCGVCCRRAHEEAA